MVCYHIYPLLLGDFLTVVYLEYCYLLLVRSDCISSCACIPLEQVYICRYVFMATYNFVPLFREATCCGVSSHVFDK